MQLPLFAGRPYATPQVTQTNALCDGSTVAALLSTIEAPNAPALYLALHIADTFSDCPASYHGKVTFRKYRAARCGHRV